VPSRAERAFTLGDWLVDPARGSIRHRDGDGETRLEPQAMALLLLFAASPGKLVSKSELIAGVWGGRAIGDDTLAAAISKLRTSLGETKHKRYIETLPKRGYRLLALPEGETAATPPPRESAGASALVAKGRAAMKMPTPSGLAQARVYLEGAIAADPKLADAHVGLAEVLLLQNFMGQGDPALLVPAARNAARTALALDETLASAWSLLGYATLLIERDFAAADEYFRKSITLDLSLAMVRRQRSFALLCVGRFVDAEREARAAAEIEPLSLSARGYLLQALLMARRYAPAVAEAKRALSLSPQSSEVWFAKGWAHHYLGEEREAVDALFEGLRNWNCDAATMARLRVDYDSDGFVGLCARTAELFQSQHVLFAPRPMDVAILRAMASDADGAFAALDEALAKGDPYLLLLPHMPHIDRLRNDPRFVALMEKVRPVH
jgi:DNA-binding winged helix-turn-helix (wHTH) protein/Flp pilus assembly protein TadD